MDSSSSDTSRSDDDLLDQVIDEVIARLRVGDSPLEQEYCDRYPHLANSIAEIFPALLAMEQIRVPSSQGAHLDHKESSSATCEFPKRLGDYELLREIGRGGMGAVFEAKQISLDRMVCVKVLSQHLSRDTLLIQRFQREAQAVARLQHPHIVPVFGNGTDQGFYFYAMQLIDGESLDRLIPIFRNAQGNPSKSYETINRSANRQTKSGEESEPNRSAVIRSHWTTPDTTTTGSDSSSSASQMFFRSAARAIRQAAEAVDYAHSRGIIHRDIKPGNLLIDVSGTAWVTDFGLAKLESAVELTSAGNVVGTLRYLAPEQLDGTTSKSCDVFGLGVTLYELLTLRPAFDRRTHAELISQVRECSPIRPRSIDPSIPRDLETIALTAMERDPRHRYPTAAALADDLQRYLDDLPIRARNPSTIEHVFRWARKRKAVAITILFAITFLSVVIPSILAVYSVLLRQEVFRTRLATRQAKELHEVSQSQLAASLIEQAKWLHSSQSPSRRNDSLQVLQSAHESIQEIDRRDLKYIDTRDLSVELFSQAISALSQPRLESDIELPNDPHLSDNSQLVALSARHYVISERAMPGTPQIVVRNLSDHEPICRIPIDSFSTNISPDSSCVMTQSDYSDGTATQCVWELPSGRLLWSDRIVHNSFAMDVEGRGFVAVLSANQAFAFDLKKRSEIACGYVHRDRQLLGLQVSWTSQIIASMQSEKILINDMKTGRMIREISTGNEHSQFVQFCLDPSGRWVAVKRSDGQVLVYQTRNGTEIQSFWTDTMGGTLAATDPMGRFLGIKSWSNQLLVWDTRESREVYRIKMPVHVNFLSLGSGRIGPVPTEKSTHFWKIIPSRVFRSYEISLDPSLRIHHFVLSPDGRLAALTDNLNRHLFVIELETGRYEKLPGDWQNLFFEKDAFWAVRDGLLYRWNYHRGDDRYSFDNRRRVRTIPSAAFTIDSTHDILLANLRGGVAVGKPESAISEMTVRKPEGDVRIVRISQDGRWLVGAGHNEPGCTVYERQSNASWNLAPEHYLTAPEFSKDNRYLAIHVPKEGLRLYEVDHWDQPVHVWPGASSKPAFSPDSRFLATSFEPGIITVLDLQTRAAVLRLSHPDAFTIHELSYSADGKKILYYSAESRCLFSWDLQEAFRELDELGMTSEHLAGLRQSVEHLPWKSGSPSTKSLDSQSTPGSWLDFDSNLDEMQRLKTLVERRQAMRRLLPVKRHLERLLELDAEDPWTCREMANEILNSRSLTEEDLHKTQELMSKSRRWANDANYFEYEEYLLNCRRNEVSLATQQYTDLRLAWGSIDRAYLEYPQACLNLRSLELSSGLDHLSKGVLFHLLFQPTEADLWRRLGESTEALWGALLAKLIP